MKNATFEDVFDLIIEANRTDENNQKYKVDKDGYDIKISKWSQYKSLQHFAFQLDSHNIKISQEFADFLTEKYNFLMMEAETEKKIDLSSNYILDFDCWVQGKESTLKYWV